MPKKSTLTADQRTQLVLRLLSKEEPAAQIARRAGISEQSLYRWRDEFISGGKHALNGHGGLRGGTRSKAQSGVEGAGHNTLGLVRARETCAEQTWSQTQGGA